MKTRDVLWPCERWRRTRLKAEPTMILLLAVLIALTCVVAFDGANVNRGE
jgi:hypothetical protein